MRRMTAAGAGIFGLGVTTMLLGVAARRTRRIDLRGRVAVVTAGGRGLGLAITRELAGRGCRLAICGRDGEVIRRAVRALRAEGAQIFGVACDASEPAQVDAFITAIIDRYEVIDVLVNNAGQCFVGPAVELPREGIRVSTITPPPLRDGAPLHVHFNGVCRKSSAGSLAA